MPSKRSHPDFLISASQPNPKIQKLDDKSSQDPKATLQDLKATLTKISSDLRDSKSMHLLLNYISNDAEAIANINAISTTIALAKGTAPPVDFSPYADLTDTFDERRFDGSRMDVYDIGEAVKYSILKIINKRILPRITKEVCFDTKLSALDTLSKMALFISKLGDSEVEDHSIRGEVPRALCRAMVQIGEMLSDSEIAQIAEEKEIVARAEEATEFKIEFLDEKPFLNLTHFTGLFLDGSVPLDFTDCVNDVAKCLAEAPLTGKQRHMQRMRRETTLPSYIIQTPFRIESTPKSTAEVATRRNSTP